MSFFSGQIWTPDQHLGVDVFDARFRDDLLPANEGPNTAEHELEYRYLTGILALSWTYCWLQARHNYVGPVELVNKSE